MFIKVFLLLHTSSTLTLYTVFPPSFPFSCTWVTPGEWNQHRSQCEDRGSHQRHVPMATPPIPPRRHPPGASWLSASILFPRKHAAPRAPARPPHPLQTPLLQKHADARPLSGRVRVGGRLLDSPQNKLHKHTHTLQRLPGRWWDYYPPASSKFLSATARWRERQRYLGTCLWTRKTVSVKRFLQISFVALFCFIIAKSSYANDLFVARRDQFFSFIKHI